MGHTLISFLVLVMVWGTATACTCAPKTLEEKYCESHFVMRLRVQSELIIHRDDLSNGYYNISNSVWKYPNTTLFRLYTRRSSAACGLPDLQKRSRYLISGTVENEQLWINSCGSIYHKGKLNRNLRQLRRKPPTCKKGILET